MNTEPHLSLIAIIFFFAEKEKIIFVYGVNEVVFAIYEADDLVNSWP